MIQIPQKDLDLFKRYIEYNLEIRDIGKDKYCGNDKYLRKYYDNKNLLYKLLGNQLIYKTPINFTAPVEAYYHDSKVIGQLRFINNILHQIIKKYWDNTSFESIGKIYDFSFFSPEEILNNKIDSTVEIKICNETFKRVENQRPFRFLRRTISKLEKIVDEHDKNVLAELKKEVEDFRIYISQLLNTRIFTGNLCISIHPLDYITMSDNDYDWTSCMSWLKKGDYAGGTVEMMNSDNVLCVYLEGEKPFELGNNWKWNNKKWRELFIFDKDFISGVKGYPYGSTYLEDMVFEILKKLAKENLNISYEDEIKLGSGEVEGCYLETYNFMYNDLTSNYNRYILTSEKKEKDFLYSFNWSEYIFGDDALCPICGTPLDCEDILCTLC